MMTRLITGFILITIIIVGGFALLSNEENSGDAMRLGVIAHENEEGMMIQNALSLAVAEINATGGLNGKQLELFIEDGGCDAQTAGIAAQKLVNLDKVSALFGGACESEIHAAGEIAQAAQILMITPFPIISENEDGYVFSIAPSESAIADISSLYLIRERSLKKILLVREASYNESFITEFKKSLEKNGGELIYEHEYAVEQEAISDDDLEIIFEEKSDVVYMFAQDIERGIEIVRQLHDFDDSLVYAGDLRFFDTETVMNNGELLNEFIGIGFSPDYENNDRAKSFLENYRKISAGRDPDPIAVSAYDALHLFADGVRRAHGRTEDLITWLGQVKNWPGALGPFSIEPNKTIRIGLRIKTIVDGKIEYVDSYLP